MASNADSGGYDCKFVEEPSNDLKCSICLCVARDPLQHGEGGCGKIFCRHCITEYRRNCNNCPNCRGAIVTFKDVRSERDIQSLKVRCENEGDGCEWIDELRSLEDHLQTCGYTLLPCPNECRYTAIDEFFDERMITGNYKVIFHKDLQAHLKDECPRRQYTCPRCGETGEYKFIKSGDHSAVCPKVEIKCPHDPQCQAKFQRKDKQKHLSTCLYEKVPCKYKDFGCEAQPLRKDLKRHENNDQLHLHITMDTVLALKQETAELRSQVNSIHSDVSQNHPGTHRSMARITFKMNNFAEKKTKEIEFFSPPFFTHPEGYKMTINVDANGFGKNKGSCISIWAYLMKGEYDNNLEFPFKGTITFELLNQLEDKNHHRKSYTYKGTEESSKRVVIVERADNASGVPAFIPHTELELKAAKNCQYLKNNHLVFRIYLEGSYKPWLQCTA